MGSPAQSASENARSTKEETELSRKGHGRECPSGIEECAEQQYSE